MRDFLGKPGCWIIGITVALAGSSARELLAAPQALNASGGSEQLRSSTSARLDEADDAMTRIDYQRARRLAWDAITDGGLSRAELTRAYHIYSLASAQLGLIQDAERGFIRLLALSPDTPIDRRLAPRRRNPLLQARGFWATHRRRFEAQVVVDELRRRILVRTDDVLGWMAHVVLWRRSGAAGEYVREQHPIAREVVFDLSDLSNVSIAAYAEILDSRGNVLLQLGDPELPYRLPASPNLPKPTAKPLRSYLGEFARSASVNGYVAFDAKAVGDDVTTFDLRHAAVYFQAHPLPEVSVEAGVEVEHLGSRDASWYAPHAFVDVTATPWLKVRAGLFPAPIGVYNVRFHPDFRRTTGHDALFTREVLPVLWSEVGLQVHGAVALRADTWFDYAVFLSNGLEDSSDRAIRSDSETVSLRDLRFNGLERFQSSKAVGGRLGLRHRQLEWGFSGYTGRYSVAARHYLSILNADFSFQQDGVTLRAEGALSVQPTTTRTWRRRGFYGLAAWRLASRWEPYLQYDFVRLQERQQRVLLGTAWYLFPHHEAAQTLRLKAEVGLDFEARAGAEPVWLLQLTSGF